MNIARRPFITALLILLSLPASSTNPPLIVVDDQGGASALPYYRALNFQTATPDSITAPNSTTALPAPSARYREADLLPLRSAHLTPGRVVRRAIQAPGLTPIFLIGDDPHSRRWLQERIETLRALQAVGLVVQVDSEVALQSLRRTASGLTLTPAAGDDLAQRLGLSHYPVLITATGIEQ